MWQIESLFAVGRRPMAIGTWILLALLMGIVPSEIPAWTSMGLLVPISISSAISLLLISEEWRGDSRHAGWVRAVSVGVSLAIPVGWSIWLGSRTSFQMAPFLLLLSVFPSLIACQVMGRPCLPGNPSSSTASRESTVAGCQNLTPLKLAEPNHELPLLKRVELGLVSDLETPVPADLTQWLTRSLTPDGEIIEGGVRVDFHEGQRDSIVHLSFCPPLVFLPEVMAEDLDGADLEIRVAATFKFGARLTIRRQQTSHLRSEKLLAGTFRIGFVAVASATRRVA